MSDEALLESLVRTPSPTGQEAEVVALLQAQARRDGLVVMEDEVGNFIAQAGQGDHLLLFVGHVDTVPREVPVRIEDGELWGRGSVDAKGALVAAYCAARRYRDHPDVQILIVGAVDEEGASRGARALPVDWSPQWIIIGEPSGAAGVTLGYKGIVRGTLTTNREVSHGAGPDASAADALVAAWSDVRMRFGFEAKFDAVQGRLDSLGTKSDGFREQATASFQLRLPPQVSAADAKRTLQEVADSHGAEIFLGESIDAAVAPRRSSLVAAFTSAIRAQGKTPRLLRKTGTADFNLLAKQHPGVPIVAYGPGDSSLDHRPDERLGLVEFQESVRVLEQVFERFAQNGPSGTEAEQPAQGIARTTKA